MNRRLELKYCRTHVSRSSRYFINMRYIKKKKKRESKRKEKDNIILQYCNIILKIMPEII